MNALWWWIDRWRKSTAFTDMTLEQQGAYRNLLDEATLRGGVIPNEDRVLEKASGDVRAWRRLRLVVMARFYLTADGWRNETLDKVLKTSQSRKEKQAKWRNTQGNGDGNAEGNGRGNNEGNSPGSPISGSVSTPPQPPSVRGARRRRPVDALTQLGNEQQQKTAVAMRLIGEGMPRPEAMRKAGFR